MKYKTIIFDLDGTLLDSIRGIVDAANTTFEELGYDLHHDYEIGKTFIGGGALKFIENASRDLKVTPEEYKKIQERFLYNYDKLQNITTKPYPGIEKLILDLQKAGYIVAVSSNKPHLFLEHVLDDKFTNIKFDLRLGQRDGIPMKPDPYCINEIIEHFGLDKKDCLYVGDSHFDFETAHNAHIDNVTVRYGYGDYSQDFVKKSTYVVDSVEELRKILL